MTRSVDTDNKAVNDNNAVSVYTRRYANPMAVSARPYHHGSLGTALLEHAERALEARGAGELSLRGLAREIGVSHAAPRRHFPDKQALLDALAERGFERLGAALAEAVGSAGAAFEARLRALATAYVGFAVRSPALLDLMYATKHDPAASDRLRQLAQTAFAVPLGVIAEGQATGAVVAGDPERVGAAAWATIHGIASMAAGGMIDAGQTDGVVAEVVDRAVLGLRPR